MEKNERIAKIAVFIAIIIGAMIAYCGSDGGVLVSAFPLYAFCVALAFFVQWVAFVPAIVFQTERFYDLTGSLTYLSITTLALALAPVRDLRSFLIAGMICIWAARLGYFLFRRILRAGADQRFEHVKQSFWRFLMAWSLQGLWVTFSLAAGLAAITTSKKVEIDTFAIIGTLVWVLGFSIEAIADWQKGKFRKISANHNNFISTGLWAWSRHPNYLGEIILWTGVALVSVPTLAGLQWFTLVSPVFVALLLIKISGIPLLEERADAKWAGDSSYEEYKSKTAILVPWPRARSRDAQ